MILTAMNIVLIGLRGSGKTSVGRVLAADLGWPLADADARIEEIARMSIREIFARDGEARFREIERQAVRELAARDRIVIATGGGVVLNEENVRELRRGGFLVHLNAPPEVLVERVRKDGTTSARRPSLLPGLDDLAEMRRVAEARAPLYAAARHMELDVSTATPNDAAKAILGEARRRGLLPKTGG
jgi:shikimate kinase